MLLFLTVVIIKNNNWLLIPSYLFYFSYNNFVIYNNDATNWNYSVIKKNNDKFESLSMMNTEIFDNNN